MYYINLLLKNLNFQLLAIICVLLNIIANPSQLMQPKFFPRFLKILSIGPHYTELSAARDWQNSIFSFSNSKSECFNAWKMTTCKFKWELKPIQIFLKATITWKQSRKVPIALEKVEPCHIWKEILHLNLTVFNDNRNTQFSKIILVSLCIWKILKILDSSHQTKSKVYCSREEKNLDNTPEL